MHKIFKTLVIILILTFTFSINVKAESITTINDLINKSKEYDEQEVTIQGEAIGERLDRGEYSWINMNDGTNAIGIWLTKDEAIKVSKYGNYDYKGDIIKITGTFYRACKEHGGEADIHLKTMEIVKHGYPVKENIPTMKIIAAGILFTFAMVMLVFFLKVTKNDKLLGSLSFRRLK